MASLQLRELCPSVIKEAKAFDFMTASIPNGSTHNIVVTAKDTDRVSLSIVMHLSFLFDSDFFAVSRKVEKCSSMPTTATTRDKNGTLPTLHECESWGESEVRRCLVLSYCLPQTAKFEDFSRVLN